MASPGAAAALAAIAGAPAASPALAPELAALVEELAADAPASARISLRPAELGALVIRVEARAEALDARFLVETAAAHAALERALPELRGVLAGSGIALGQASVGWAGPGDSGAGARGRSDGGAAGDPGAGRAAAMTPAPIEHDRAPAMSARRQGQIDVLA